MTVSAVRGVLCVFLWPQPGAESEVQSAGRQLGMALGEALNSLLLTDGEMDKNKDAHLPLRVVRGLIG